MHVHSPCSYSIVPVCCLRLLSETFAAHAARMRRSSEESPRMSLAFLLQLRHYKCTVSCVATANLRPAVRCTCVHHACGAHQIASCPCRPILCCACVLKGGGTARPQCIITHRL